MKLYVLLTVVVVATVTADRRVGFADKAEESERTQCTQLTGTVPSWINGYLLRQLCGGVGPQSEPSGSKIEHMFDCMGMVAAYQIQSGNVFYTSKFYDTKANAIWSSNSYKMEQSKVAWPTRYTNIDSTGYSKYHNQYTAKPDFNPNVMFWKIGSKIAAVSEDVREVLELNVVTLGEQTPFNFTAGSNLDEPPQTTFINNVAHAAYDANGTLWSSVIALEPVTFNGQLFYDAYRLIYTIDPVDGNRTVKSKEKASESRIDLSLCRQSKTSGRWRYQDPLFRIGYTHSIAMTDKFVVIPSTNLFIDPCFLLPQLRQPNSVPKPEMRTWLGVDMINKTPSQIVVFRKHDGQLFTFSALSSMFFMHAINAYDDPLRPSIVNVDLLTYTQGAKAFTTYFALSFLNDVMGSWPTESMIYRYSMDTATQKIGTGVLNPGERVMAIEFPVINNAFAGKPYKYVYVIEHPFSEQTQVIKLDVNQRNLTSFTPPFNTYVGEAQFVQRPDSQVEDDGVLLVPAFNSTNKKGLLFFVDAQTMQELGAVEAPVLTPFGLHNRYFSAQELAVHDAGTRATASALASTLVALGLLLWTRQAQFANGTTFD